MWLLVLGAAITSACEFGVEQEEAVPLRLRTVEPEPGQGLDCDLREESGCGVPVDVAPTFGFDRWLLPRSVARQALVLSAGSADFWIFGEPEYDIIERRVRLVPTGLLLAGTTYRIELLLHDSNPYGYGFRAYDGGSLELGDWPRDFVFRTGSRVHGTSPEPRKLTCDDALDGFRVAGCTSGACHTRQATPDCSSAASPMVRDQELGRCVRVPRAGLWLDDHEGLADMVGRVARSTDFGGQSGKPLSNPERFGTGMTIVDPARPENSLLLYRLLLDRRAYQDADGQFVVQPPDAQELARARTWLGGLGPMPPDSVGFPRGISPIDEIRSLALWIRQGAELSGCDASR